MSKTAEYFAPEDYAPEPPATCVPWTEPERFTGYAEEPPRFDAECAPEEDEMGEQEPANTQRIRALLASLQRDFPPLTGERPDHEK